MKKLYLVDVSSMFFRAFYAIRPLTNPQGLPVNALYGFLSMTVKLLREIRPDYMAFCFDTSSDTFRKEIDPRYKANRSEMPADLVPQIPYFRRLSEALGIHCLEQRGFEADDIIGTLTALGREHGLEVVIVSGDKDFAQLVKPFVTMYDTMKDVRYDDQGVMEKWGVEPRKFKDFLSIVGDSSDNIPGVAGIGLKGAQKLLVQFDSLEEIYENLDKVESASIKKKLEISRDEAFLSKKLVTIVCDMKLGVLPEDLKLKPIHREELSALLLELDFKTFAKTLLGDTLTAKPAQDSAHQHVEGSVSQVLNPKGREGATVSGAANLAQFVRKAEPLAKVEGAPAIESISEERLDLEALERWLRPDTETWALHTERAAFLAQENANGWMVVEVAGHGPGLGEILTRKKLKLKGFDLKDFSKRYHLKNPNVLWDQMLAAYVIRAGPIDDPQKLFSLYNGESLPDLPTPSQILAAHFRLEFYLRRKLKSIGGEKVLFEIDQPLVPILVAMESYGVLLDLQDLSRQSKGLVRDIAGLEKEIHIGAGEVFNIGSPKQLGHILFEKLKMPTGKKTKTGFSTDNEVLEKLEKEFPLAGKVVQWRELSKLRSTYVDALPQMVNKESGRIHTTFNQAMTSTGRLSSINPNLQNIPIRTERGNEIRKAFIADPGSVLISADYSQIELRILAHITSDPGLMRAFEAGIDIHTATASEIFDTPVKEVTPDMRRKAKAVNFGLAYGQSAFGLAETLRISRKEAAEVVTRYFSRFSGVQSYMTETVEEAKKRGYVETVFGRRRYLDELYSNSPMIKKFGERAAINAPIQGTASDLVKLAMIKAGEPSGSHMLLQVHDELVYEVRKENSESVRKEVTQKMESVAALKVPLRVNTGVGLNWNEAHS
jgi:DNA polymerase-1